LTMSYYDDVWLLEGSEPEPWTEEDAPFGLCEFCESPLAGEDDCEICTPRCSLEYDDPIRASFIVNTATGAVTERAL
jgi:hypothetical protein